MTTHTDTDDINNLSLEQFLKGGPANNVHDKVLSYLQTKPEMFGKLYVRTWLYLSDTLHYNEIMNIHEMVKAGMIHTVMNRDDELAVDFLKHMRGIEG